MRYLVVGTGALGSVFGGLLQHCGQSVAFMGRGPHFAQAVKGWRSTAFGEISRSVPQVAPLEPESSEHYDVILLCVKSFDTQEACRGLRGMLAPQGLIVSVQNGLGTWKSSPKSSGSRTIGARVIFGAQVIQPGLVRVRCMRSRSCWAP